MYRLALFLGLLALETKAFTTQSNLQRTIPNGNSHTRLSTSSPRGVTNESDEALIQWELMQTYHAKGSWKGVWSTYDYMGDMMDETIASVDLQAPSDAVVQHTHTIVVGAKRSDCATCFDTMDTKTLPIATYTPETFKSRRPIRLASRSWVNGPTVLKSGAVATEVILAYEDGRVRAMFQHAPVWPKDIDTSESRELPPPQGLRLFRVTVSREALRDQPPTADTEAAHFASAALATDELKAVKFYRPVPPFNWHKVWSGTSWTWGPSAGNQGWAIESLEEGDAWHGSSPVDAWNLRLPGGLFLQSPRIISPDTTGLLRVAWMPNDEVLLRAEAGVLALQPMELNESEDLEESTVFAFEPPSLASLRCDVLRKVGDLEGEPQFVKDQRDKAAETTSAPSPGAQAAAAAAAEAASQPEATAAVTDASKLASKASKPSRKPGMEESKDDAQTIGDILQL